MSRLFGPMKSSLSFVLPLLAGASVVGMWLLWIPGATKAQGSLHRLDLPLHFEPNVGQAGAEVAYIARNNAMVVTLERDGTARFRLGAGGDSLTVRPVGGAAPKRFEAREPAGGVSNYYLAAGANGWRAGVVQYRRVRLREVWPGVDVEFYGTGAHFEYDFLIQAGAKIPELKMAFHGARRISAGGDGSLLAETPSGVFHQRPPSAHQQEGDQRRRVECSYSVEGNVAAIVLGPYRQDLPLVVDPVVDYSTYLGGEGEETLNGLAVDASGNVYVTGSTNSLHLPTGGGAVQPGWGGGRDVFVAKLSPDASTLHYITYLGGAGDDRANAIAVDAGGNAYLAGYANTGFPATEGAYRVKCCGAFAVKLSAGGGELLYSTFLGSGEPYAAAVDSGGNLFLAGSAYSGFPVTPGAAQSIFGGETDAFALKLDPTGAALVYSTFLGGNNHDRAYAIGLNAAGDAFLAGYTYSANFPATPGAYRTAHAGDADAFAARFSVDGRNLVYATLLGGAKRDEAHALAVAANDRAYLAGITFSPNFPITPGVYGVPPASPAATGFAAAVEPAGNAVLYSTTLGAVKDYYVTRFGAALDPNGSLFVTGAAGAGFPTTGDAIQRQPAGGTDAFVVQLSPSAASAEFATYIGGSGEDYGRAIALDSAGRVVLAGYTASTNYPAGAGSLQPSNAGGADAFIARIDRLAAPCNLSLTPGDQTVGAPASTGMLSVSASAGCPWTASSDAAWLTVTSGASGTGSGSVGYAMEANPLAGFRAGRITVKDKSFTLYQMGTQNPVPPTGPTAAVAGRSYSFSTRGLVYPGNVPPEYRFDWGGGRYSSWGGATQTAQWLSPGVYFVRAQARSSRDTELVTGWSSPLVVNVYHPEGVLQNEVFAAQIYWDILNRQSDAPGLAAVVAALNAGVLTRTDVTANLLTSQEFYLYGGYITRCYLAIMRRGPDFDGWLHWYNNMRSGYTREMIAAEFVKADEFVSLYGTLTNTDFVNLVYNNVLGRDPDPEGFTHWLSQLDAGTLTRAGMMTQFIISNEYTQATEKRVWAEVLHLGLWRRTPAASEVADWLDFLHTQTLTAAMEYFLASPEYLGRFQ